ncbi:transcriptional activator domain-containing protein [Rhizobium etli]|uniref:Transcriptional activator domain-containing protein n=1 Tax=Rhizobium etli TaxID=29449 RepID=A0AAN1EJ94_RHIET|nr:BTAD domain-containing putative transcriptional regulator [Rhizobium etli]ARQ09341.1 transcriptional activator domain-containing protein [Rhizobium etli]
MRIRLLGGLEATSGEGGQVRFATRKTLLLFAALALAGRRGCRREVLSETFWPGRSNEQARSSLRQALVDIRRLFPASSDANVYIDGDQETVALIFAPGEADISLFERKLVTGSSADLAFAADLYRGELLEGQSIPDELGEWFAPYRSTYQRKALQLVERLSLALLEPGSAEELPCEGLAERLLASDPTAETAHRALMRIHTLRGHENMALRQFETCRALLKKHLGVEPEAETSSLAATLQPRQRPGDPRAAAPAVEPQPQAFSAPRKHHDRPSLAVLPFQNLSGDLEQEYFADGIVEDITIALAQFRHLYVIARNSSFTYKGQAVDIKRVGRELDVDYVVEGSVRRAGDRLRIAGQLIDTSTGAHLWADRFDGTLANLFDLQDQVASSIVGAITPKVEEAEIERAKRKPTESLDAYDYYLRGLAAFDRTVTNRSVVDEALRLFMKAIERDRDFAIAHARAARCYATRKSNGWMVDPANEIADATRLARRAVELGWDDAVALSYGGYVLGYVGGDLDESAACIDRALFLNPNLAAALGVSSWVRACLGEPDKAVEHAALAMRLSPLDPRLFAWQFNTGLAHFCAGRYEDAAVWAAKSLRHQPNYPSAMRVMAAGHAMAGHRAEAEETITRLRLLDPALRLSNLADILPPFRRPEDRSRYIEALRMAGLPE